MLSLKSAVSEQTSPQKTSIYDLPAELFQAIFEQVKLSSGQTLPSY
jgi:hypothetical protein